MARTPDQPSGPITRSDLENRFGAFQRNIQGKVEERKASLATVLGIGAVVVLVVVFLFGRRAGRRKSTFVEIRRL